MSKKEKSPFSHFFKEDAQLVQGIYNESAGLHEVDESVIEKKDIRPRIIKKIEASEDETREYWYGLRSFFRNGNNRKALPEDLWPVVMAPLYTKSMIGQNFPVWVANEKHAGGDILCISFRDLIGTTLAKAVEEPPDAQILNTNSEHIIHIANQQFPDKNPQLFDFAIHQILETLQIQLDVTGSEKERFETNLKKLENGLPDKGVLLTYSINTSFQLLEAAMIHSQRHPRQEFNRSIGELQSKLSDLLKVEKQKGPEAKDPDKLKDSLSFIGSMVKFNELSSILPDSASEKMPTERIERIKGVVKELQEAQSLWKQRAFVFIDEWLYSNKNFAWDQLFEHATVTTFKKAKACGRIRKSFDKQIDNWTRLIAAKRIGELELANNYHQDIHDDFFKYFTWESFSAEELQCCPHFILIADDIRLFESEYSALSALIASNYPVKIVAVKREDYVDHQTENNTKPAPDLHSHAELSALMLSHKNIYVLQSTSITPTYLFQGFMEGLSAFSPAFFYVLNVDEHIHDNPFVWTSASIEGRDFPGFSYKGLLGTPWGSRFEISNNPQSENLWPVHSLEIIKEEEEKNVFDIQFTFADHAVLNPAYHPYYLLVDPAYWNEDLIPIAQYLENSSEENVGKVPFIWVLDKNNELQKLAVSWHIVLATQERLDFWRFLQENSGINNYHVSRAVEKTREALQEKHVEEMDQLKSDHALEIQKIREEEAGKVMENLTAALLNLDTTNLMTPNISSLASTAKEAIHKPADSVKQEEEEEEEIPKEAGEETTFSSEAYIDTALCTSCNDCLDVNKVMFKYNENKMAYIADASAGTFRELVEAAEKCPVAIIHPGTPLNPDEPDLEELMERAAKFN